jgi:hypothetical protein
MKKLLSLTLILILAAGLSTMCKKDKGNPPVLPPAESMTIDFSNFTSGVKSADFLSVPKGTEDSNFQFAAGVALFWKSIIYTTLIIPVTSFKLAVDQTPVYLDTKTWQWSYNVTVASVAYKVKLTGVIGSTDVKWKMLVTKDGAFTDFLWFDGTSKLDGTGGQWILYQSPQAPGAIVQIDWTKSGTTMGSVKYTYIKTADSFKDSYIEYGLTSAALNAYYTVRYYNSILLRLSEVVNIEWNTTAHNGRMKCTDYLGDTKWYCWDTNKINVTCPL